MSSTEAVLKRGRTSIPETSRVPIFNFRRSGAIHLPICRLTIDHAMFGRENAVELYRTSVVEYRLDPEQEKMKIEAEIPTKAQILSGGFPCKATARGEAAKRPNLGDYADKKGVYIFHSGGKLLYVGKTTKGKWGNFGDRLYRHLAEAAAASSPVNKMLRAQKSRIKVYLLDLGDIDMMINPGAVKLNDISKALIMEQILIGVFNPTGNDPNSSNDE